MGLGFGDEGKGTVTDFLTREYGVELIIRYNGGPQAAHNVVDSLGRHHCFSQFGSGTFIPGVKTYLSPGMFIDPIGIKNENNALMAKKIFDANERLFVHGDCPIVTPYHQYLNRIEELARGNKRHGSCGVGMGQAYKDSLDPGVPTIYYETLFHLRDSEERLRLLREIKISQAKQLASIYPNNEELQEQFRRLLSSPQAGILATFYYNFVRTEGVMKVTDEKTFLEFFTGNVLFEGAQGVLLDKDWGFWPHVTPSQIVPHKALELAKIFYPNHQLRKIGVLRAYSTRHGSGPFVCEEEDLTNSLDDPNVKQNPWQGVLRKGWLDLPALRYSLSVSGGVDELAITGFDLLEKFDEVKLCTAYKPSFSEEHTQNYFEEYYNDKTLYLKNIKNIVGKEMRKKLTEYLHKCLPCYKSFPGWPYSLDKDKCPHPRLKDFLDFLMSEEGLNHPIRLLSTGPGVDKKSWLY